MTAKASWSLFVVLSLGLGVSACTTIPYQHMSDARQAIESAEPVAPEYADSETLFEASQEHLEAAEEQLRAGEYDSAREHAEQARRLAIEAREIAEEAAEAEAVEEGDADE